MLEDDLVVGTGDITIKVESEEAKDNFLEIMGKVIDKSGEIKEKSYTCGDCAAYPCFRTMHSQDLIEEGPSIKRLFLENPNAKKAYEERAKQEASRPAGLCYQTVRECRQECKDFAQIEGSGKSPEFQIKGNCKKDNVIVNYDAKCRFLDEK